MLLFYTTSEVYTKFRMVSTFQQANDLIDEYIHLYNHERLQIKTGLAPLSLRQASL